MSVQDYRNLVIGELADSEAELREQNATLIDIITDLAFENCVLRRLFDRELVERIHADGTLARTRRTLREQRPRPQRSAA